MGPEAERIASAIRAWAAELPPGSARCSERSTRDEYVFRFEPPTEGAAVLEIRIGGYGGYGLYFGRVFAIEEVRWPERELLDVLDAVRAGKLREEVWEWRARVRGLRGELQAPGRILYDRVIGHWPFSRLFGQRRWVSYSPWHTPAATDEV